MPLILMIIGFLFTMWVFSMVIAVIVTVAYAAIAVVIVGGIVYVVAKLLTEG